MNSGTTDLRERGGCLTVYLLATVVFAILGLALLLLAGAAVTAVNVSGAVVGSDAPSVPILPILISIVAIVVTIVGVYGAWSWKKWGIYLIVASMVISALGSLVGGSAGSAIISLVVELAILWYLLKDKWTAFEG